MSIQILGYRGISGVSDGIKLLTYSVYSHSAALFTADMNVEVYGKTHFIPAGSVTEAWKGGVKLAENMATNHKERTQVDIFELKTPLLPEQENRVAQFLVQNIGKKYAYFNVLRFVPIVRLLIRKPLPWNYLRTHVFCSELVMLAFNAGGVQLLERCQPWEIPPRDIPRSPLLYQVKSVWT